MDRNKRLEKDEWGRSEVYLANYSGPAPFGGSSCVFTNLNSALFFIVSGLGSSIDWATFPDPTKTYPYEERNGSDKNLNPIFVVKRKSLYDEVEIIGSVQKIAVMSNWSVGNRIAVASKKYFADATGKDIVVLSGEGSTLSATVKK
jgi:hypothetical protein